MASFPGQSALHHARSLSFPRKTGSAGWHKSRDYIVAELQKLGYAVLGEKFPIQADPSLFNRGLITFTLLLLVVSYLVSKGSPLLAALLMFLPPFAVATASLAWNAWISSGKLRLKPQAFPGVNLVADLPPQGESQGRVLLVAHYDSKGQSLSLPERSLLLLCLVLLCLIVALLYLSASHVGLAPFPPPSRKQMAFLSAVAALCALMIYRNKTFDTSPGALDDASGVGVLLTLAEAMKEEPPTRTRVTFLFTDAEEEGLLGAWSYLKSHPGELSLSDTYILNLEGIGLEGRLLFLGKWGSELAARILRLAKGRGIPLRPCPFLPGVLMDHLPFRWQGLQAATLFCLSFKSFYIHTPKDRPDLLEEGGLREAGELALSFIREIDQAQPALRGGEAGREGVGF